MVDGALPAQVGSLTGNPFIWRDGAWRSVDVSSQLVYLCGGQLVALGRRALASGLVRLGPRLPQRPRRRRTRRPRRSPPRAPPPTRRSCGVQTDTELLSSTRWRDAETPPTQQEARPTVPSKQKACPTVPSRPSPVLAMKPKVRLAVSTRILVPVSSKAGLRLKNKADTVTRDSSVLTTVATRDTSVPTTVTTSDSEGEVVEFDISQEHVEIYRNFLERTASDMDLKRFDEDDEYKQRMFFRFQPVVCVARSLGIEALLRTGRTRAPASELCAEHFAAQLGLTPTAKRKRESDSDENLDVVKRRMRTRRRSDTENKPPPRQATPTHQARASPPAQPHRQATPPRDADSSRRRARARQAPPPREAPPTRLALAPLLVGRSRASRPPPPPRGVPYSSLEDQSIVSWLSASERRERGVNGNRIWKELQRQFGKIAGQERSWHSLRNRYLRSVLPSLHRLALPLDTAKRLRAHAAIGEMKAQKSRRNSIFATRTALSAARPATRSGPGPDGPDGPAGPGSTGSPVGPASPGRSAPAKPAFDWSESEDDRPLWRGSPPLRAPPRRRGGAEPTKAPENKKVPRTDTPESYSALTKRFALRPRASPATTPGSGNSTPAKGTVPPGGTTPAAKTVPPGGSTPAAKTVPPGGTTPAAKVDPSDESSSSGKKRSTRSSDIKPTSAAARPRLRKLYNPPAPT